MKTIRLCDKCARELEMILWQDFAFLVHVNEGQVIINSREIRDKTMKQADTIIKLCENEHQALYELHNSKTA